MSILFYLGFTSDSMLNNPHKSTREVDSAFTGIETNT